MIGEISPPGGTPGILHLQPIYHASDLRLAGFELLYRTADTGKNPGRRAHPRSTQDIILGYEHRKLIGGFDRHLLFAGLEVARQLDSRRPAAAPPLFLNINQSGQTMGEAGYTDYVRTLTAQLPGRAVRVQVEITETADAADSAAFGRSMAALRRAGIGIVLDDFPKGHNHMERLLTYADHIDAIKLDKTIIETAMKTRHYGQIRQYAEVAGQTGKHVVAEGVQSGAMLKKLHDHGVTLGQGYGLGTPAPIPRVLEDIGMIETQASRPMPLKPGRTLHFTK